MKKSNTFVDTEKRRHLYSSATFLYDEMEVIAGNIKKLQVLCDQMQFCETKIYLENLKNTLEMTKNALARELQKKEEDPEA